MVEGLSHISANYSTACNLLKERFGRSERIISAHIVHIEWPCPCEGKGPQICDSSLESQRWDTDTHQKLRSMCKVFPTPIILSCLPSEFRLEWICKGAEHESDLDWLLTFLQQEIESIERSEAFKDITAGKESLVLLKRRRVGRHRSLRERYHPQLYYTHPQKVRNPFVDLVTRNMPLRVSLRLRNLVDKSVLKELRLRIWDFFQMLR